MFEGPMFAYSFNGGTERDGCCTGQTVVFRENSEELHFVTVSYMITRSLRNRTGAASRNFASIIEVKTSSISTVQTEIKGNPTSKGS